jgi:hypothetical protein
VEGISPMFFWGVLLWYFAVLVFAMTSLVAVGLLLARRTIAARIAFAVGLLYPAVATLPVFLAWLKPLTADSRSGDSVPLVLVVLAELSLLLAGFGQFIARAFEAAGLTPWSWGARWAPLPSLPPDCARSTSHIEFSADS